MDLLKIINESSLLDDITAATIKEAYQINVEMSNDLLADQESLEDFEKQDLADHLDIMQHLEAVYLYFTGVNLRDRLG